MTINDIMLRDIMEAEREERERAERETASAGDEYGFPWLAVSVWLAAGLAMLGAAFAGGMCYQSHRALKADRDFAAWNERVEREATEAARAMSNQELLNATERIGRAAADR
jgi:hypothetical protein